MTPEQIYDELTNGPGSETLEVAQKVSYDESAAERDRADRIRQLMATIEGGWQGSAADGAHGAARPLADNAAEGAEYLYMAQDLLDRQTGSFHRAADSVEPMPASDPQAEMIEQMVPFDLDTDAQVRDYQQKAQHNIRVFEGYDNASNHNETYLPQQFASTNHTGGGISVAPGDSIRVDDTPRGGEPRGGGEPRPGAGPGPGPGSGPGSDAGPGAGPGLGAPGGTRPESAPSGSQTAPSDFRPSGDPSGAYPLPPAALQQPGAAPPGGVTGLPGGGFGEPGARGSGTREPGGAGPRGAGASGPGPGARLPGPGVGAGALAAEEAAVRRGVVAAGGRGGMSPMAGPMGGGRGKNEDDEEHTRKVLIEADPESTFGSEELTAPQVIGDDEYEN